MTQKRLQDTLHSISDITEKSPESDGLGDGGQVDVDDGRNGLDSQGVGEIRNHPRQFATDVVH